MHILKEDSHCLLFSPFAIGGVWRLQVSVMIYFALDAPEKALSEQALWSEVPAQLGEGGFLDPGFPKPTGEVLVAGSWYAPHGVPCGGGRVRVRVGSLERELRVFGERFWKLGPTGPLPSEPAPLASLPLTWERAFGGEGFAENPAGRGFVPVTTPWDERRRPLPQVEDPACGLVLAPGDVRPPAALLPLPADAPSRLALAGTYDDTWLKECWPGFPRNVHPDFFALAQAPLRLKEGFFAGGEPLSVEGMHPAQPVLHGQMPRLRVRVFATRRSTPPFPHLTPPQTGTEIFEESATRLDTLWLFPSLERGLVLYRAILPCADDEYTDLIRLMSVVEAADAPLTDIEYWQKEQQRRLHRAVPVDPAPLEEAKRVVENALAAIRTADEDVHHVISQTLGQAPTIPLNPARHFAACRQRVQDALTRLDDATSLLGTLHRDHGHLVKIDVRQLDATKASVRALLPQLDKAEAEVAAMNATVASAKSQITASYAQAAAHLEKTPGLVLPPLPPHPLAEGPDWSREALALLGEYGQWPEDPALAPLQHSGLRMGDTLRAGLAVLPQALSLDPRPWGLPDNQPLHLPAGLVVPYFEGTRCVGLSIRPLPSENAPLASFLPCAARLVPGSSEGLLLLGAQHPKPVLLALDPLEGWLLYAELGDVAAVLVATSPQAPVPDVVADYLASAPCLLWPVPPLPEGATRVQGASGEAGTGDSPLPPPPAPFTLDTLHAASPCAVAHGDADSAAQLWKTLAAALPVEALPWPAAYAAPSLAHARRQGFGIRAWLLELLRERGLPLPSTAQAGAGLTAQLGADGTPQIALNLPLPDVTAQQAAQQARMFAFTDKARASMLREGEEALAQANERFVAMGQKPIAMPDLSKPGLLEPLTPDPAIIKNFDRTIAALHEESLPDLAVKAQAAKQTYLDDMAHFEGLRQQGQAAFAKTDAVLADPVGQLAPDLFTTLPQAAAMLNPAPMTPQVALASLNEGKGVSLKDLDFSGFDLSGRHFENAVLENICFRGANLSRATFSKVIGTGLDFTDARLDEARLYQGSFAKCDFTRCDMRRLDAELFQWQESCFVDASFAGARFSLSALKGCEFSGVLEDANFELCSLDGKLHDLTLRRCSMKKCSLQQATLNTVRIEGGRIHESSFVTCTGNNLDFVDVDANNMRFLERCVITGVRFTRCDLSAASLRMSTLAQAVFSECLLKEACIDHCDLPFLVMERCLAPRAQIRHSNLEGASLVGLSLPEGSLRRTRLVNADLTRANLYGAELYKAVFGQTRIDGANLERTLLVLVENPEELLRRTERTS